MGKGVFFKFENGVTVQDKVTMFRGVITARSEHLYGCNRYFVNPHVVDGKMIDGYWFDEDSLDIVDRKQIQTPKKDTGGPHSNLK